MERQLGAPECYIDIETILRANSEKGCDICKCGTSSGGIFRLSLPIFTPH